MRDGQSQDTPNFQRFVARFPRSAMWWECWPLHTSRADGYAVYGTRTFFGELYAHRIVATAMWGPIPEGWEVDHMCVNPPCCNPFHLRVVPLRENRPGGRSVTECRHGHSMVPGDPNVYVNPSTGRRHCRACMAAANRRYHAANRDRLNVQRGLRRVPGTGPHGHQSGRPRAA